MAAREFFFFDESEAKPVFGTRRCNRARAVKSVPGWFIVVSSARLGYMLCTDTRKWMKVMVDVE